MRLDEVFYQGSGTKLRDDLGNIYQATLTTKSKGNTFVTCESTGPSHTIGKLKRIFNINIGQQISIIDGFAFTAKVQDVQEAVKFECVKEYVSPMYLKGDLEGAYFHIDTIIRASSEDTEDLAESIQVAAQDIAQDATHLFTQGE